LDRLRIAMAVPPMLPVPPVAYAGTERVVAELVAELGSRGHSVTLFAAGDSQAPCEVVPIVPESLWATGYRGDVSSFMTIALAKLWAEHDRFDVIHSHLETLGFLAARLCPTPIVTTLHGRLDCDGIPELLAEFTDIPLVAISESQRRFSADNNWVATIHHGLDLRGVPFRPTPGDYLVFVGRVTPEKGVADAIQLARMAHLKLKMVAKVYDEHEQLHFAEVVQPAIEEGIVEFMGELGAQARDPIIAGARATVMLGAWPEPFGLVAIESMATGTPVIARRAGALTETVEHGVDGFLVDDLSEGALAVARAVQLDRRLIRNRAFERFSRTRMVDEYEAVYRALLEPPPAEIGVRMPAGSPAKSPLAAMPLVEAATSNGLSENGSAGAAEVPSLAPTISVRRN
jgi:glycosyltransferase involved in cell wall biosynthesis